MQKPVMDLLKNTSPCQCSLFQPIFVLFVSGWFVPADCVLAVFGDAMVHHQTLYFYTYPDAARDQLELEEDILLPSSKSTHKTCAHG